MFIHPKHAGNIPGLLGSFPARQILTMSDIDGFSKQGGMVELSTRGDQRIHLFIDRKALRSSGLSVENRLLGLAE